MVTGRGRRNDRRPARRSRRRRPGVAPTEPTSASARSVTTGSTSPPDSVPAPGGWPARVAPCSKSTRAARQRGAPVCTLVERRRAHAHARPARVQPARCRRPVRRRRDVPGRRTAPGDAPAALLDGPPRIVDPVFVVCPPRSGSSFLFETLQRSPSLATIGGESHEVIEGIAVAHARRARLELEPPRRHRRRPTVLSRTSRSASRCACATEPAAPCRRTDPSAREDAEERAAHPVPRARVPRRAVRLTSTATHEKRFRACSTPGVRAGSSPTRTPALGWAAVVVAAHPGLA